MPARRLASFLAALAAPLASQTACGRCDGTEFLFCAMSRDAETGESASTTDTTATTDVTGPTTTDTGVSATDTDTTEPPTCNMNDACDNGESPQLCPSECKDCGNGVRDDNEVCDDGADNSPDNAYHGGSPETAPCNSSCTAKVSHCGDGTCQASDENSLSCADDGCAAECGNGVQEPGEACDDANLKNTDACLNDCQAASCGDGFIQVGMEECDDTNLMNTDACTSTCKTATCGDGFTWAGMEDCDDANVDETDACDQACKTVVHRKVFVSSASYSGNLGGIAGANMKCQTLADMQGLDGTFKAWLSDGVAGPANNFDTGFTGVYELVDGTLVAHGWGDLTDMTLAHAIDLDEKAGPMPEVYVWTNTSTAGMPAGAIHCTNWTSGIADLIKKSPGGLSSASDAKWTFYDTTSCAAKQGLYCFEDPA